MAAINVGIVLISILSLLVSNAAVDFDFRQWCERTAHKNVCIAVIEADLRTNLKNSAGGLCTILNDKAKNVADVTSNKIPDLLNKATDPYLVLDLQYCFDAYDEIVSRLKGLNFSILNNQSYTELNIELVPVVGRPGDCEDSFKPNQPKPIRSPLTIENNNLGNIISTTWNILNLDHCDKMNKNYQR